MRLVKRIVVNLSYFKIIPFHFVTYQMGEIYFTFQKKKQYMYFAVLNITLFSCLLPFALQ